MAGRAELLARRELLLRRCAEQRRAADAQFRAATGPVAGIDRRLEAVRRWAGTPVVAAIAVALAVLAGRRLPARSLGTVASLASAGWSLRRLLLAGRRADSDRH